MSEVLVFNNSKELCTEEKCVQCRYANTCSQWVTLTCNVGKLIKLDGDILIKL